MRKGFTHKGKDCKQLAKSDVVCYHRNKKKDGEEKRKEQERK